MDLFLYIVVIPRLTVSQVSKDKMRGAQVDVWISRTSGSLIAFGTVVLLFDFDMPCLLAGNTSQRLHQDRR